MSEGEDVVRWTPPTWVWWVSGSVLVFALIAGITAFALNPPDPGKDKARDACEQVALLRGSDAEFVNVEVEHVSADLYSVTGTVKAPGLDDEEFRGLASKDSDGTLVCTVAG